jgi:kynureninase
MAPWSEKMFCQAANTVPDLSHSEMVHAPGIFVTVSPLVEVSVPTNMPPLLFCVQMFSQTTIADLRAKSKLLTGYLEYRLIDAFGKKPDSDGRTNSANQSYGEIITPRDPEERGCQLSVKFSIPVDKVFAELTRQGVAVRICNVLFPISFYNA